MTAPFVPFPNGAKVTMNYTQADGSPAVNTLWFQKGSDWDSAQLTTLANGIAVWADAGSGAHSVQERMSDNFELSSVEARAMDAQGAPVVISTDGLPLVGTVDGASIPLGLTFAVTLRTGLAGKSQRGRIFMVGLPASALANEQENVMDATYVADAIVAWNSLIAAAADIISGCVWGVASHRHNKAYRDAVSFTPITSIGSSKLTLDFQRRRAPFHNRSRY